MKKHFLWAILLMTLTACSAQNLELNRTEDVHKPVFYGMTESVGITGTRVYADSLLRVLWENDDRITIFNRYSLNREYRFIGDTGDNSGSFEEVPFSGFVTGNEMDYVYAVYPYQSSTKIDYDGRIWFDQSATQVYRPDTFGLGSNMMVAVSEDNDLRFKNVCGYLSFKFFGEDIQVQSISIKGNDNEPLAGKACITTSLDAAPSISFDESSALQELTLVFESPVTLGSSLEEASLFWLVIPPVTFKEGFTMTVSTQRGYFIKKTSKPFEIHRSQRSKMAALQVIVAPVGLEDFVIDDDGWDW